MPRKPSTADSVAPEKPVGALTSGLNILRYLNRVDTPVGVTQIARELELNPSTCFNLLKTLVFEGLVTFHSEAKTYSLGLGLVEMARGALENASYARFVRPHLEEIVAKFRMTATLWQRQGDDRVVLVEVVDNREAVRVYMSIGQRLPMYVAALGRCMAAHSGLSKAQLKDRFNALRWQDAPSFESYLKDVEAARINGYAIDEDRFVKGVTTVSSPVLAADGQPIMAISAVGFSGQFAGREILAVAADIRDRAREVTSVLSGVNAGRQRA